MGYKCKDESLFSGYMNIPLGEERETLAALAPVFS